MTVTRRGLVGAGRKACMPVIRKSSEDSGAREIKHQPEVSSAFMKAL